MKVHLALHVSDLDRSVAFYEALFGSAPLKKRHDYAKFEPADGALVLSLNPSRTGACGSDLGRGALSHLGLRFETHEELASERERLASLGFSAREENQTVCCYARQDKLWFSDPDGNEWELYVLLEDVESESAAGDSAPGQGQRGMGLQCC